MKTAKYLLVISVDALNKQDYDYIQTLPAFKSFFDEGAHSKDVTSVYPTVTYTCHTSIGTGRYPGDHGIFNNELPQPHKATVQDWNWYEKDIKVPTFFDYAKKANMTIGTVLWPVMAGADVTYNAPEIWSPDESVSGLKLVWKYGTRNTLWSIIRHNSLRKGKQQPYLDNFSEAVSMDIIKKGIPNIMAIHFTDLDTMRHIYGLHSDAATGALNRIDKRITNLIQAYKDAGIYEETNFVLLGDHGTHDFDKVIELNSYFEENGLLQTDGQGTITEWKAYACTCGGSAQVHLHTDATDQDRHKLREVIDKLTVMPKSPILQILTREEAREKYSLDGDFEYVLEAKDHHDFKNTVNGGLVHDSSEFPGIYKGDHGYLPTQEDQKTLLLMKGPSVKKGAVIEKSALVDEGPTFAAMLGLTMVKTDGRVLSELLL